MSGLEVFCAVDDVMLSVAPHWKASELAAGKRRQRSGQVWPSEIMPMVIPVHQSHARTCNAYDTEHVHMDLRCAGPHLVSSPRVVALIPTRLTRCWPPCNAALAPAPASASVTRPRSRCVTPHAFPSIGSVPPTRGEAHLRWAASSGSHGTWRSLIAVRCEPAA